MYTFVQLALISHIMCCTPVGLSASNTEGGKETFAVGAIQIGQLEESGRSGRRSGFLEMQTQRMAAMSPICEFVFCAASARSAGNAA